MRLAVLFAAAILLAGFSTASAHSVKVFAFEEGGQIRGEGYFADGSKIKDSKVEVFDGKRVKLLETRTDGNGEFQFPSPGGKEVVIVLTASMGHRTEFVLPLAGAEGTDAGTAAEEEKAAPGESPAGSEAPVPGISEERLRAVVNEVFDARMKPIVDAVLSLNKEGPSLVEIIGGVGYIVGLFGVFFFLKGRKEKQ
jgi:nickel transport protein